MSERCRSSLEPHFWLKRPLQEFSHDEWEAVCDGCGRCCLHKLEDQGTGRIYLTRVACRFLDLRNGRCAKYEIRQEVEPDCLVITLPRLRNLSWIPETCAYRLLAEGDELPLWHPLRSGRASSVLEAGISVCEFAISEESVAGELEDHVIDRIG